MKVIDEAEAPKVVHKNALDASCELERIYYEHTGRRILKWHHFLRIYDYHLGHYRNILHHPELNILESVATDGHLRILEIGVQHGGSLQMWRNYFGENAIIFGIDIDPRCKGFEENGCQIRIGSQADPEFLNRVVNEMGGVDIVVDDGSHITSHQLASFKALFGKVNNGGLYIVEDLHTSYWDTWEGGLRRPGAFIEIVKDIIDHMHEWYIGVDTGLNALKIKTLVTGLHVYDSLVVIEKATKNEPYTVHVGESSFDTTNQEQTQPENIGNEASHSQGTVDDLNAQADSIHQTLSWKKRIANRLSARTKQRIRKALHIFGIHV